VPVPDSSKPVFVPDRLAVTISIALVAFAVVSWVASYYLMPLMMGAGSGMMSSGVAGIVSSLSFSSLSFFEVVWIVGMAAMMFPAMIPIVLFYNRVAAKRESNPVLARTVGTPLFLGGYLIMYAILGLGAFVAIYEVLNLSMGLPESLVLLSVVAPGAVLIVAGIYQFTPLKTRCLSHCVSPIGFFALHYSNGLGGSFRMGFRHGVYCVGCCWAFMLVMLAVGAMSIPVMAILAGVIALEKVIVRGAAWFNRAVAGGFIALGVLVVVFPSLITML
jgi:predicted metal-binding membrane protein